MVYYIFEGVICFDFINSADPGDLQYLIMPKYPINWFLFLYCTENEPVHLTAHGITII